MLILGLVTRIPGIELGRHEAEGGADFVGLRAVERTLDPAEIGRAAADIAAQAACVRAAGGIQEPAVTENEPKSRTACVERSVPIG